MILKGGYPFPILLSSIVFFLLFAYTFRFRKTPETIFFMVMMVLMSLQGIFSIQELLADGLEDKLLWRNLQQIPLYYSPVMLLGVVMSFIGKSRRVVLSTIFTLSILVFAYWGLLFTDGYHHFIRDRVFLENFGDTQRIHTDRTYFGYLFLLLNTCMGLWAVGLLSFNVRNIVGNQKRQHFLLITAILVPYFLPEVAGLVGLPVNIAVSTLPTGLLFFYALHMYHFLQVRPMAKEKVLEHMTEGILVVDEQGLIIDANPAARQILSRLRGNLKLEGAYLTALLEGYPVVQAFALQQEQVEMEAALAGRHYTIRSLPIQVRQKRTGSLFIITDITERKTYEQELIRQSTKDGLTELNNRRHFLELLERKGEECRVAEKPISLLLIDVDHFKKINDRYGHLTGDRVLKHLAGLLGEAESRWQGVAGRIGGEEFALLLPGLDGREAYEAAEQLRLRLQQELLRSGVTGGGSEIAYTISIGVAEREDPRMTLESWYHEADTCLYASKNNGRNRTTLAG